MGDLPFLVVHGAWVWKAVVLLSAITGAAIYRLIHRRRVRRWLAPVAPGLDGEITPLDAMSEGGPALLRGRLRAAGNEVAAATLSLRRSPGIREQTVHTDGRTEQLELDVGGTRVPLRGDVHVLVGSREETRRGAPAHIPPLLRPGFERLAREYTWIDPDDTDSAVTVGRCSLHVVGEGDELLVAGSARGRASNDPRAGYRDLARAWQLEGSEGRTLHLAAVGPARARLRPLAALVATSAVIGGLVGMTAVLVVGEVALGCAGELAPDDQALTIASATPARDRALARMEEALQQTPVMDPAMMERRAALAELQGDCGRQAMPYRMQGQWEREAEILRSCGPTKSAALVSALLQVGDATGAADVAARHPDMVSDKRAFEAFLLAKRWRDLSIVASMIAEGRGSRPLERDRWACIAQAAAWRAGDREAIDELGTLAERSGDPACAALLVDALPPEERASEVDRWLDRLKLERLSPPTERVELSSQGQLLALLAIEAEPARLAAMDPAMLDGWRGGTALMDPFRRLFTEPHWAMALHVHGAAERNAPGHDALAGRARFAELASMVELVAGDRDRARALADRADALWHGVDPELLGNVSISSEVDLLRASIAYRSGDMLEPRFDYLGEHLRLRRGQPIRNGARLSVRIDQGREQTLRAALAQAAIGDATALAAEFEADGYYGFRDWTFAVAPRVTRGADELAYLLGWVEEGIDDTRGGVATRLYRAAGYRDLFTLLGAREQAARWKAIADRHMQLFRDRDLVVFLQVAGR